MHPRCCCHAVARVITKLVRKCTEGVRIIICLHCMVLWGCCSWGHNNSYQPIHVVKSVDCNTYILKTIECVLNQNIIFFFVVKLWLELRQSAGVPGLDPSC